MTTIAFFLGIALGACLWGIAQWLVYAVEIRRADRRKFLERCNE